MNNYINTKEWLKLACNNIERVIRNFKISDYPECVFKIQLSVEQLQKALILLLGLQFRKIHDPSRILDSIENNNAIVVEKEILDRIKEVASLAKNIEGEGAATRYGIIEGGKLISPGDRYDKLEAVKYLKDLKEILINFKEILRGVPNLVQDLTILSKLINACGDLMKG